MSLSAGAIQGILFALFSAATSLLDAIIGPMYDHLLVPELEPSALYPGLGAGGGGGFLAPAVNFSDYLLTGLVDPAIALVAALIGLSYLLRAALPALRPRLVGLLPRLVAAVLLANLSVPVAGAILGLAGAAYPVVAGFDGGAWQHWNALGGYGLVAYSWDNGALAFVLAFVLFSLVLLLVLAVAVRNALLAVLLVLLPAFTLLWPVPPLSGLARRGWLWFVELAFLPCVLVVPLELAVGAGSIVSLVAYLLVALGSPALLALAGSSLSGLGWPSAGGAIVGGVQRGLSAASSTLSGFTGSPGAGRGGTLGTLAGAAQRSARQPAPLALPAFSAEMLGHGARRLLRHVGERAGLPISDGPAGTRGAGPVSSDHWRARPIRASRG